MHKKCSGIKGYMIKASKSLVCRGGTNRLAITARTRTSVDTGDGASLELVFTM